MSDNSILGQMPELHEADIEAFWQRARTVAKLNPLEIIVGQDTTASLRPAAWCCGFDKASAQSLCALILEGKKKATSSWKPLYALEEEELPSVGELSILCDGQGNPRALLRNTEVRLTPFSRVGEDIALAEGEGPLSQWVREHEEVFRAECSEIGIEFDPQEDVVTEFFEVLYKH